MNTRTSIKSEAADAKEGMTLGELQAAIAAADGLPPESRIKVRVGYSGQIRTIEFVG